MEDEHEEECNRSGRRGGEEMGHVKRQRRKEDECERNKKC